MLPYCQSEDDYLLKVLNKELKTIPGVVKTRTTVVLSSPKVDSKNFINCSSAIKYREN